MNYFVLFFSLIIIVFLLIQILKNTQVQPSAHSSNLAVMFKSKRIETEAPERIHAILHVKLEEKMMFDKVYKNKDISLFELARQLNTNSTYLSSLVNRRYNCNFSTYVNSFRVKDACEILKSDVTNRFSIDQVADLVGFSSRRAFYSAFKRELECSPAQYKKNQLKNSLPTG